MAEGFSESAKSRAARGMIGTDGLQVRVHSDDPGSDGTANGLGNDGGYAPVNIDNGDLTISAAGVVTNDNQVNFTNPTGNWSAMPAWISVWTREGTPVFLVNIDIADVAIPGSNNTVNIPANGLSLNPIPSPDA